MTIHRGLDELIFDVSDNDRSEIVNEGNGADSNDYEDVSDHEDGNDYENEEEYLMMICNL